MPRSLAYEVACIEDTIALKKKMGKDAKFEEALVKEYKRYLPGGDLHHLWTGEPNPDSPQ